MCSILERAGFVFRRQAGSHMILRRDSPFARVVVPDHKQVRPGTLRRIIADAGLTLDEFLALRQ
ncbi:MAG: type II toxin-antitoxin system HicA family toxin [Hyphomicrobiaceae bacterium]